MLALTVDSVTATPSYYVNSFHFLICFPNLKVCDIASVRFCLFACCTYNIHIPYSLLSE